MDFFLGRVAMQILWIIIFGMGILGAVLFGIAGAGLAGPELSNPGFILIAIAIGLGFLLTFFQKKERPAKSRRRRKR